MKPPLLPRSRSPLPNRRAGKTARGQGPARNPFRPYLEGLESRLAPANVSVPVFHYDPAITGQNLQETVLTPANVNATTFGKLANQPVDGYVYAQPLYMANLMIGGSPHNVAFVATEHDTVYAFEVVNDPSIPTGMRLDRLWQRSFINPAAGVTTVPSGDVGSGDIVPEIGITGAPVIDAATNTLYVVAKTKEVRGDGNHYVQKLYALDITNPTGADRTAPYTIGDSKGDGFANQTTVIQVAGNGADSGGGQVRFNAFRENQRPSLQLLGGRVYVGWASHSDNGPFHGWVVGFNETTLQPEKWFNTTPNAGGSGIWQSQGALSTDGTFLYFATGNGFGANAFDVSQGNYSEAVLRVDPRPAGTAMVVSNTPGSYGYFVPNDWRQLDNADADLGSGGVMLLPDSVGGGGHTHLMVETGKNGKIYLIDRGNLGGNVPQGQADPVVQVVTAGPGGVWGNPAFYQESASSGLIYYHGSGADTRAFRITGGMLTQVSAGNFIAYRSNQTFGFPGAQPIISGNGPNNPSAIDWELQSDNYGQQGPEVLHAYAARPAASTGTLTELYNSNQTGQRDQLGGSVKFTSPIVSNGLVFVGQEYNFSVFGLFPAHGAAPAAPTNLAGMGVSSTAIQLTWASPNPNTATGIKVFRSTDGTTFTQANTVAAAATTYTDTGLSPSGTYFYKIAATNQAGDSPFTNTIQVTPLIAPVLSPDNVCSNQVALVWTRPAVANDHYNVERSTTPDFTGLTTIATGLPGNQLSYTDRDPILVSNPGQYFYRVRAFTNPAGTTFALSNVVAVRVGAGSAVIDYFNGFPSPPAPPPPDLQANGSAQFAETTARLTNANNQAGSVFSVNEENILNWNTTFRVRLHEGTQPNYADGFAFVIQAFSSLALGQGGGGLGYQGIPNSVCVKFDTFNNEGENGSGGSTGLFFGGSRPTVPHQPGEVNLPLDATTVNLLSQSQKTVTLSYAYNAANPAASVLHEEIVDADHATPFTHDYMVDLPSKLGLPTGGNTIGYVGLTASTGDMSFWELQDVLGWRYTPTGPAAPHGLTSTAGSNFVDLAWKCTSADEEGSYVERSQNPNTGFTRIATLGAGVTTYHDAPLTSPQGYYYRVQTFNHNSMGQEQDSGFSNVATGAVVAISFPNFATHANLSANTGNPPVNLFPGNPPVMRLTDGGGGEASTAFYNTPIGTGSFSTTFTLQDRPNIGAADGVSFVIQNDPRGTAALGAGGGGEGYAGIVNSIAVKFDLYTHGSHNSSTGLFTGGQSPDSDPTRDVPLAPIDLRTGDPLQVTLTYDGATLTETVRDTVTAAVFTHAYALNLAQVIGGNSAYVGFAGGTGGENATQDVLSWSGQFAPVVTHFGVTGPSSTVPGAPFSITVTALDAADNVVTGYTGTVTFSSTDPGATLPPDYQFSPGDRGVHVFDGLRLFMASVESIIIVIDPIHHVAGQLGVCVAGPATHYQVEPSSSTVDPGSPFNVTVTALDSDGNLACSYAGTAQLTYTPQDNQIFWDQDQGTHALQGGRWTFIGIRVHDPGPHCFTATDTADPSITGQGCINVNAGPDHIQIDAPPSVPAGQTFPITLSIRDPYGNLVTDYAGTVTFTSSDLGATLPPDYAFTPADGGVHIFTVTLATVGTQSVTATDTADSTLTGSATIEVTPPGPFPGAPGDRGPRFALDLGRWPGIPAGGPDGADDTPAGKRATGAPGADTAGPPLLPTPTAVPAPSGPASVDRLFTALGAKDHRRVSFGPKHRHQGSADPDGLERAPPDPALVDRVFAGLPWERSVPGRTGW
jgi:hypothetical protein